MAHAPTPAMRLRADVRLFGDILGRVLAAEEGEDVFQAIEAIRQASVAYHREGTPERAARLDELLRALSLPDALRFAHSFVCFSQLINIAEDEGVGAADVRALLDRALVMPVITAHPSEVRRKSVIDRVSRIAEIFDAHDRAAPEAR